MPGLEGSWDCLDSRLDSEGNLGCWENCYLVGSLDMVDNWDYLDSLDLVGNSDSWDLVGNLDYSDSLDLVGNLDYSDSWDLVENSGCWEILPHRFPDTGSSAGSPEHPSFFSRCQSPSRPIQMVEYTCKCKLERALLKSMLTLSVWTTLVPSGLSGTRMFVT